MTFRAMNRPTKVLSLVAWAVATLVSRAFAGPQPLIVPQGGTGSRMACEDETLSLGLYNSGDDFAYYPFLEIVVPVTGGNPDVTFDSSFMASGAVVGSDNGGTLLSTVFPNSGGGTGCVNHPFARLPSQAPVSVCGPAGWEFLVASIPDTVSMGPDPTLEAVVDFTTSMEYSSTPVEVYTRGGFRQQYDDCFANNCYAIYNSAQSSSSVTSWTNATLQFTPAPVNVSLSAAGGVIPRDSTTSTFVLTVEMAGCVSVDNGFWHMKMPTKANITNVQLTGDLTAYAVADNWLEDAQVNQTATLRVEDVPSAGVSAPRRRSQWTFEYTVFRYEAVIQDRPTLHVGTGRWTDSDVVTVDVGEVSWSLGADPPTVQDQSGLSDTLDWAAVGTNFDTLLAPSGSALSQTPRARELVRIQTSVTFSQNLYFQDGIFRVSAGDGWFANESTPLDAKFSCPAFGSFDLDLGDQFQLTYDPSNQNEMESNMPVVTLDINKYLEDMGVGNLTTALVSQTCVLTFNAYVGHLFSDGSYVLHSAALPVSTALGITACDPLPRWNSNPAYPDPGACVVSPIGTRFGDSDSIDLDQGTLVHSLYAIDGVLTPNSLTVFPGRNLTFRLHYSLPFTSFDELTLSVTVPFPLIRLQDFASDAFTPLSSNASLGTIPPVGYAGYGPADTFFVQTGSETPTVTEDPTRQKISFTWGEYSDEQNRASVVDILYTLQVRDSPLADQLSLPSVAQSAEAAQVAVSANTQTRVIARQPKLELRTGALSATGNSNSGNSLRSPAFPVITPTLGSPFSSFDPASDPMGSFLFSSTVDSDAFQLLPTSTVTNLVNNLDAGDDVYLIMAIVNDGGAAAYDMKVTCNVPLNTNADETILDLGATGDGSAEYSMNFGDGTTAPMSGGLGTIPDSVTITRVPGNLETEVQFEFDAMFGSVLPDGSNTLGGKNLRVFAVKAHVQPYVRPSLTSGLNSASFTCSISQYASRRNGQNFIGSGIPLPQSSSTTTARIALPALSAVTLLESSLTETSETIQSGSPPTLLLHDGEEAHMSIELEVPEGRIDDLKLKLQTSNDQVVFVDTSVWYPSIDSDTVVTYVGDQLSGSGLTDGTVTNLGSSETTEFTMDFNQVTDSADNDYTIVSGLGTDRIQIQFFVRAKGTIGSSTLTADLVGSNGIVSDSTTVSRTLQFNGPPEANLVLDTNGLHFDSTPSPAIAYQPYDIVLDLMHLGGASRMPAWGDFRVRIYADEADAASDITEDASGTTTSDAECGSTSFTASGQESILDAENCDTTLVRTKRWRTSAQFELQPTLIRPLGVVSYNAEWSWQTGPDVSPSEIGTWVYKRTGDTSGSSTLTATVSGSPVRSMSPASGDETSFGFTSSGQHETGVKDLTFGELVRTELTFTFPQSVFTGSVLIVNRTQVASIFKFHSISIKQQGTHVSLTPSTPTASTYNSGEGFLIELGEVLTDAGSPTCSSGDCDLVLEIQWFVANDDGTAHDGMQIDLDGTIRYVASPPAAFDATQMEKLTGSVQYYLVEPSLSLSYDIEPAGNAAAGEENIKFTVLINDAGGSFSRGSVLSGKELGPAQSTSDAYRIRLSDLQLNSANPKYHVVSVEDSGGSSLTLSPSPTVDGYWYEFDSFALSDGQLELTYTVQIVDDIEAGSDITPDLQIEWQSAPDATAGNGYVHLDNYIRYYGSKSTTSELISIHKPEVEFINLWDDGLVQFQNPREMTYGTTVWYTIGVRFYEGHASGSSLQVSLNNNIFTFHDVSVTSMAPSQLGLACSSGDSLASTVNAKSLNLFFCDVSSTTASPEDTNLLNITGRMYIASDAGAAGSTDLLKASFQSAQVPASTNTADTQYAESESWTLRQPLVNLYGEWSPMVNSVVLTSGQSVNTTVDVVVSSANDASSPAKFRFDDDGVGFSVGSSATLLHMSTTVNGTAFASSAADGMYYADQEPTGVWREVKYGSSINRLAQMGSVQSQHIEWSYVSHPAPLIDGAVTYTNSLSYDVALRVPILSLSHSIDLIVNSALSNHFTAGSTITLTLEIIVPRGTADNSVLTLSSSADGLVFDSVDSVTVSDATALTSSQGTFDAIRTSSTLTQISADDKQVTMDLGSVKNDAAVSSGNQILQYTLTMSGKDDVSNVVGSDVQINAEWTAVSITTGRSDADLALTYVQPDVTPTWISSAPASSSVHAFVDRTITVKLESPNTAGSGANAYDVVLSDQKLASGFYRVLSVATSTAESGPYTTTWSAAPGDRYDGLATLNKGPGGSARPTFLAEFDEIPMTESRYVQFQIEFTVDVQLGSQVKPQLEFDYISHPTDSDRKALSESFNDELNYLIIDPISAISWSHDSSSDPSAVAVGSLVAFTAILRIEQGTASNTKLTFTFPDNLITLDPAVSVVSSRPGLLYSTIGSSATATISGSSFEVSLGDVVYNGTSADSAEELSLKFEGVTLRHPVRDTSNPVEAMTFSSKFEFFAGEATVAAGFNSIEPVLGLTLRSSSAPGAEAFVEDTISMRVDVQPQGWAATKTELYINNPYPAILFGQGVQYDVGSGAVSCENGPSCWDLNFTSPEAVANFTEIASGDHVDFAVDVNFALILELGASYQPSIRIDYYSGDIGHLVKYTQNIDTNPTFTAYSPMADVNAVTPRLSGSSADHTATVGDKVKVTVNITFPAGTSTDDVLYVDSSIPNVVGDLTLVSLESSAPSLLTSSLSWSSIVSTGVVCSSNVDCEVSLGTISNRKSASHISAVFEGFVLDTASATAGTSVTIQSNMGSTQATPLSSTASDTLSVIEPVLVLDLDPITETVAGAFARYNLSGTIVAQSGAADSEAFNLSLIDKSLSRDWYRVVGMRYSVDGGAEQIYYAGDRNDVTKGRFSLRSGPGGAMNPLEVFTLPSLDKGQTISFTYEIEFTTVVDYGGSISPSLQLDWISLEPTEAVARAYDTSVVSVVADLTVPVPPSMSLIHVEDVDPAIVNSQIDSVDGFVPVGVVTTLKATVQFDIGNLNDGQLEFSIQNLNIIQFQQVTKLEDSPSGILQTTFGTWSNVQFDHVTLTADSLIFALGNVSNHDLDATVVTLTVWVEAVVPDSVQAIAGAKSLIQMDLKSLQDATTLSSAESSVTVVEPSLTYAHSVQDYLADSYELHPFKFTISNDGSTSPFVSPIYNLTVLDHQLLTGEYRIWNISRSTDGGPEVLLWEIDPLNACSGDASQQCGPGGSSTPTLLADIGAIDVNSTAVFSYTIQVTLRAQLGYRFVPELEFTGYSAPTPRAPAVRSYTTHYGDGNVSALVMEVPTSSNSVSSKYPSCYNCMTKDAVLPVGDIVTWVVRFDFPSGRAEGAAISVALPGDDFLSNVHIDSIVGSSSIVSSISNNWVDLIENNQTFTDSNITLSMGVITIDEPTNSPSYLDVTILGTVTDSSATQSGNSFGLECEFSSEYVNGSNNSQAITFAISEPTTSTEFVSGETVVDTQGAARHNISLILNTVDVDAFSGTAYNVTVYDESLDSMPLLYRIVRVWIDQGSGMNEFWSSSCDNLPEQCWGINATSPYSNTMQVIEFPSAIPVNASATVVYEIEVYPEIVLNTSFKAEPKVEWNSVPLVTSRNYTTAPSDTYTLEVLSPTYSVVYMTQRDYRYSLGDDYAVLGQEVLISFNMTVPIGTLLDTTVLIHADIDAFDFDNTIRVEHSPFGPQLVADSTIAAASLSTDEVQFSLGSNLHRASYAQPLLQLNLFGRIRNDSAIASNDTVVFKTEVAADTLTSSQNTAGTRLLTLQRPRLDQPEVLPIVVSAINATDQITFSTTIVHAELSDAPIYDLRLVDLELLTDLYVLVSASVDGVAQGVSGFNKGTIAYKPALDLDTTTNITWTVQFTPLISLSDGINTNIRVLYTTYPNSTKSLHEEVHVVENPSLLTSNASIKANLVVQTPPEIQTSSGGDPEVYIGSRVTFHADIYVPGGSLEEASFKYNISFSSGHLLNGLENLELASVIVSPATAQISQSCDDPYAPISQSAIENRTSYNNDIIEVDFCDLRVASVQAAIIRLAFSAVISKEPYIHDGVVLSASAQFDYSSSKPYFSSIVNHTVVEPELTPASLQLLSCDTIVTSDATVQQSLVLQSDPNMLGTGYTVTIFDEALSNSTFYVTSVKRAGAPVALPDDVKNGVAVILDNVKTGETVPLEFEYRIVDTVITNQTLTLGDNLSLQYLSVRDESVARMYTANISSTPCGVSTNQPSLNSLALATDDATLSDTLVTPGSVIKYTTEMFVPGYVVEHLVLNLTFSNIDMIVTEEINLENVVFTDDSAISDACIDSTSPFDASPLADGISVELCQLQARSIAETGATIRFTISARVSTDSSVADGASLQAAVSVSTATYASDMAAPTATVVEPELVLTDVFPRAWSAVGASDNLRFTFDFKHSAGSTGDAFNVTFVDSVCDSSDPDYQYATVGALLNDSTNILTSDPGSTGKWGYIPRFAQVDSPSTVQYLLQIKSNAFLGDSFDSQVEFTWKSHPDARFARNYSVLPSANPSARIALGVPALHVERSTDNVTATDSIVAVGSLITYQVDIGFLPGRILNFTFINTFKHLTAIASVATETFLADVHVTGFSVVSGDIDIFVGSGPFASLPTSLDDAIEESVTTENLGAQMVTSTTRLSDIVGHNVSGVPPSLRLVLVGYTNGNDTTLMDGSVISMVSALESTMFDARNVSAVGPNTTIVEPKLELVNFGLSAVDVSPLAASQPNSAFIAFGDANDLFEFTCSYEHTGLSSSHAYNLQLYDNRLPTAASNEFYTIDDSSVNSLTYFDVDVADYSTFQEIQSSGRIGAANELLMTNSIAQEYSVRLLKNVEPDQKEQPSFKLVYFSHGSNVQYRRRYSVVPSTTEFHHSIQLLPLTLSGTSIVPSTSFDSETVFSHSNNQLEAMFGAQMNATVTLNVPAGVVENLAISFTLKQGDNTCGYANQPVLLSVKSAPTTALAEVANGCAASDLSEWHQTHSSQTPDQVKSVFDACTIDVNSAANTNAITSTVTFGTTVRIVNNTCAKSGDWLRLHYNATYLNALDDVKSINGVVANVSILESVAAPITISPMAVDHLETDDTIEYTVTLNTVNAPAFNVVLYDADLVNLPAIDAEYEVSLSSCTNSAELSYFGNASVACIDVLEPSTSVNLTYKLTMTRRAQPGNQLTPNLRLFYMSHRSSTRLDALRSYDVDVSTVDPTLRNEDPVLSVVAFSDETTNAPDIVLAGQRVTFEAQIQLVDGYHENAQIALELQNASSIFIDHVESVEFSHPSALISSALAPTVWNQQLQVTNNNYSGNVTLGNFVYVASTEGTYLTIRFSAVVTDGVYDIDPLGQLAETALVTFSTRYSTVSACASMMNDTAGTAAAPPGCIPLFQRSGDSNVTTNAALSPSVVATGERYNFTIEVQPLTTGTSGDVLKLYDVNIMVFVPDPQVELFVNNTLTLAATSGPLTYSQSDNIDMSPDSIQVAYQPEYDICNGGFTTDVTDQLYQIGLIDSNCSDSSPANQMRLLQSSNGTVDNSTTVPEDNTNAGLLLISMPSLDTSETLEIFSQGMILPGSPPGTPMQHLVVVQWYSAPADLAQQKQYRARTSTVVASVADIGCDASITCGGNGECISPVSVVNGTVADTGLCACATGWTGERCCDCDTNVDPSLTCYGHGTCTFGTCICDTGYDAINQDPFCSGLTCEENPAACSLWSMCPINCDVSTWYPSDGECRRGDAGIPLMLYSRNITRVPENDGDICPYLVENRTCDLSAQTLGCKISSVPFTLSISSVHGDSSITDATARWAAAAFVFVSAGICVYVYKATRFNKDYQYQRWQGKQWLFRNWRNYTMLTWFILEAGLLVAPAFLAEIPWLPYIPLKAVLRIFSLTGVRVHDLYFVFFALFGICIVGVTLWLAWQRTVYNRKVEESLHNVQNRLVHGSSWDTFKTRDGSHSSATLPNGSVDSMGQIDQTGSHSASDELNEQQDATSNKQGQVRNPIAVMVGKNHASTHNQSANSLKKNQRLRKLRPDLQLTAEHQSSILNMLPFRDGGLGALFIICYILATPILATLFEVWKCGFPFGGYKQQDGECIQESCWTGSQIAAMIFSAILLACFIPAAALHGTKRLRIAEPRFDAICTHSSLHSRSDSSGSYENSKSSANPNKSTRAQRVAAISETPMKTTNSRASDIDWAIKLPEAYRKAEVQPSSLFFLIHFLAKCISVWAGVVLSSTNIVGAILVIALVNSAIFVLTCTTEVISMPRLRWLPRFAYGMAAWTAWLLVLIYGVVGSQNAYEFQVQNDRSYVLTLLNGDSQYASSPVVIAAAVLWLIAIGVCIAIWKTEQRAKFVGVPLFRDANAARQHQEEQARRKQQQQLKAKGAVLPEPDSSENQTDDSGFETGSVHNTDISETDETDAAADNVDDMFAQATSITNEDNGDEYDNQHSNASLLDDNLGDHLSESAENAASTTDLFDQDGDQQSHEDSLVGDNDQQSGDMENNEEEQPEEEDDVEGRDVDEAGDGNADDEALMRMFGETGEETQVDESAFEVPEDNEANDVDFAHDALGSMFEATNADNEALGAEEEQWNAFDDTLDDEDEEDEEDSFEKMVDTEKMDETVQQTETSSHAQSTDKDANDELVSDDEKNDNASDQSNLHKDDHESTTDNVAAQSTASTSSPFDTDAENINATATSSAENVDALGGYDANHEHSASSNDDHLASSDAQGSDEDKKSEYPNEDKDDVNEDEDGVDGRTGDERGDGDADDEALMQMFGAFDDGNAGDQYETANLEDNDAQDGAVAMDDALDAMFQDADADTARQQDMSAMLDLDGFNDASEEDLSHAVRSVPSDTARETVKANAQSQLSTELSKLGVQQVTEEGVTDSEDDHHPNALGKLPSMNMGREGDGNRAVIDAFGFHSDLEDEEENAPVSESQSKSKESVSGGSSHPTSSVTALPTLAPVVKQAEGNRAVIDAFGFLGDSDNEENNVKEKAKHKKKRKHKKKTSPSSNEDDHSAAAGAATTEGDKAVIDAFEFFDDDGEEQTAEQKPKKSSKDKKKHKKHKKKRKGEKKSSKEDEGLDEQFLNELLE